MIAGRPWMGLCLLAVAGLVIGLALPAAQVQAQGACRELVEDGGFEGNAAWQLGLNPVPPRYESTTVHSGARSLHLGIADEANQATFSSARTTVHIPQDEEVATLSFWYYPMIDDPDGDYMEVVLLSQDGASVLDKLWSAAAGQPAWQQLTFDVSNWRGRTLQLYFNVYNDGMGGKAAMLLDDVSLTFCPESPTAMPSPTGTGTWTPTVAPVTPTATRTPWAVSVTPVPYATTAVPVSPTASPAPAPVSTLVPPAADCVDLLVNGGFDRGLDGWSAAPNKLPAQLVTSPVAAGTQAVRLGTRDENAYSYSSVQQKVAIPAGYQQVVLDFWTYTWAESLSGADHQEAALLSAQGAVRQKLWRELVNDNAWTAHRFTVTAYAGDTVSVYFNVVNDGVGGRTGMVVDEAHLWACGLSGHPAAGPGPITPTATRFVPPTVTATSTSAVLPAATMTIVPTATASALPTTTPTTGTVTATDPATQTPAADAAIANTVTPRPGPRPGSAEDTEDGRVHGLLSQLEEIGPDTWPGGWWLGAMAVIAVLAGVLAYLLFVRSRPRGLQ